MAAPLLPAPVLVQAQIAPAAGLVVQTQEVDSGELVFDSFRFLKQPDGLFFYLDRLGRLIVEGPQADHYVLDIDGYLHYKPCLDSPLTSTLPAPLPGSGVFDGTFDDSFA